MVLASLTPRIVASREQDSTRSLSFSNDVASGRRTQYAVLTNKDLFHSVSGTNLSNQLNELWIVEASVSANNQEAALCALRDGEDDAGDEGLAVVGLLEDGGLLAKA